MYFVIPANAAIDLPTREIAEPWVPAFASASRLLDEDRRDPGRRRTFHSFAPPAFGIALAGPRLRRAWPFGLSHIRVAFAAQLVHAGANRGKIVGCAGAAHRTSLD
jgi:hypothetical protein